MDPKKRTELLGSQSLCRLLFRLSGPAITGMVVQSMYNLVDTIFVGKGVGTLALAALAVCFPVQMVLLGVGKTVGIGSASIISRKLGAGKRKEAGRIAGGSFALAAVLGLTVSAAGLVFMKQVLELFGASATIMPYGREYLSTVLLSGPLFAVTVCSNDMARSEGNARVAMISMFMGAGVNIVLDPVFIFGLNMGIRGAALATVIGQTSSFIWITSYFFRGSRSNLEFGRRHILPGFRQSLRTLQIGSPAFARIVGTSLMALTVNNVIMHYGSEVYLAILGVINRITIFAMMPIFGLVQGLQPIIGYNYGAGNYRRVRRAMKLAITFATVLSSCYFLVFQLAPTRVLSLFSSDPDVIGTGKDILRTMVLMMPVIGFQVIGAGTFQALGKAGKAFILSTSRQILFLIPLALLLPRIVSPHIRGLWFAFPSADLLAAILTSYFFIREVGRMKRVSSK